MYAGKNTILLTYDGFSVSVSQNTAKHSREMVEGQPEKDADQDNRLTTAEDTLDEKLNGIGTYSETTPESTDEVLLRRPGEDTHYKALISALTGGAGYDAIVSAFATNATPTPIYTNAPVTGYTRTALVNVNAGAPTNRASFSINGSISYDGTTSTIATNALTYNGILEQRHFASTNPTVYWSLEDTNAVLYFTGVTNEQFHLTSWVRLQSNTNHIFTPGSSDNITNGIVAWWDHEESSGDRVDEMAGYTLVNNNAVASSTLEFKVGTRSSNFESDSSQSLQGVNTILDFSGNDPFTISVWFRLESTNATQVLVSKWNSSANQKQYRLYYSTADDRYKFAVSSDGVAETVVTATNAGSPGIANFHHIIAWRDPDTDEIGISVDGSSEATTTFNTTLHNGSGIFALGYNPTSSYADGRMDETYIFNVVKTPTERATIESKGDSGLTLFQ
jgi:hypothetical protein